MELSLSDPYFQTVMYTFMEIKCVHLRFSKLHVCHFMKGCKDCGAKWQEDSEMPELLHQCPLCSSWCVVKFNHQIK